MEVMEQNPQKKLKLRERVLAYVVEHQKHGIVLPIVLIVLLISLFLVFTITEKNVKDKYKASVRAGEKADDDVTRISFAGDIVLGRNVKKRAEAIGYDKLFERMQDEWKDSDCVVANLDTCVIDGDPSQYEKLKSKDVFLCTDRKNLSALKIAGIDVLSIATDHIADYGRATIKNAIDELDSIGIKHVGAGENREKALECEIIEVNGKKIAIFGALGYQNAEFGAKSQSILDKKEPQPGEMTWEEIQAAEAQGSDSADSDETAIDPWQETAGTLYGKNNNLLEAINNMTSKVDAIVVYVHWGDDKMFYENDKMQELAHNFVIAGADLVIGTNPRVLLPAEVYKTNMKTGVIFYSIGTFVFDDAQSRVCDSVGVDLVIDANNKMQVEVTPVRINECVPTPTNNKFYVSRIFASITKNLDESQYIRKDNKIIIGFND